MHPLLDPFEKHIEADPSQVAVCDPSLTFTRRQFQGMAKNLAASLRTATEREFVGVLAPTSAAGAAAIYACWYAGRVPVPLNFMLAPPELAKVVRDADLDLIICAETLAALAQPLAALAQPLGVRILPLTAEADGAAGASNRVAMPAVRGDDLAILLYTSGTLGEPKGACLTFDNVACNAAACIEAAELNSESMFLGLLPQFHAFGLTTTIVPLTLGATVHYLPRFSPTAVVSLIAEKHVSVFITIASMYGALAGMKDATPAHFASLTHPISGGEPLSPRIARIWEERFGVRILEGYGMTEASPVVTLNTRRHYRRGSVGRPLPGITVDAVGPDGRAVATNLDGELVVRGHCVMRGYRNKPEQSALAVRDGALYTGDVGRIDADGFVYITGRAKEMLIVGGENVFPFEIESVLTQHPGVAEAAVIGMRDELRGELPVAFVIPPPGCTPPVEADLRAFCRDRLAPYKIPRRIFVEATLPRGPTGKILKRALTPPT